MTAKALSYPNVLRSRWRRGAAGIVLGAATALAFAPYYVVPMLWPGLVGLAFLALSAASTRGAAALGWCFGVGFFGFGLYWIGHAFLVDAERYAALMPLAVGGMAIGMAVFTSAAAAGLHAFLHRLTPPAWSVPLVFAALWTLTEWLRGILLTGFPWNPLGSVWGGLPEMMQAAAWVGTLGLSFLTAVVFSAPVVFVLVSREDRNRIWGLVLVLSAILPLMWGSGALRLSGADTLTREDVVVRLVQPAIPQAEKWQRDLRRGHVLRQMAMSKREPGFAGTPTVVIWAETNVPFVIGPDSLIPAELAPAVPPGGHLIFGAPRRDSANRVFNSLFVVDDNGDVQADFDKFHLVPFGEYVPLRGFLPFEKLTEGRGDFSPGPGPQTLRVDGVPPFAAIICYEVIFAGRVTDPADRPEWIVNITNDAWFGPSAGPRQHFVQATLRAIEEGLPLVRVANTGISAVIDAYGRVRNVLDLDAHGVLDAPLPTAIAPTPFVRLGHLPVFVLIGVSLAIAGTIGWRRRKP